MSVATDSGDLGRCGRDGAQLDSKPGAIFFAHQRRRRLPRWEPFSR